ncbi:Uncharacterized protein dnm_097730 [Desulfonema magnum]|uniref:Uncharacterized protein n=1 Tax=Desulfonema magnum TaxID=45655 RepID=A0A975BZU1_9BACT|nr:Uncharacterized protein dnm_097730 [Desulfonema magnum]
MPPTQALPNGSGVQKFYFCACEKTFFALRIRHQCPRLRHSRTAPECKNFIFAPAKKHFSHSG